MHGPVSRSVCSALSGPTPHIQTLGIFPSYPPWALLLENLQEHSQSQIGLGAVLHPMCCSCLLLGAHHPWKVSGLADKRAVTDGQDGPWPTACYSDTE